MDSGQCIGEIISKWMYLCGNSKYFTVFDVFQDKAVPECKGFFKETGKNVYKKDKEIVYEVCRKI